MHRRTQFRTAEENGTGTARVNAEFAAVESSFCAEQVPRLPPEPPGQEQVSEIDAEAALVHRARSGDREAFSDLISGHCQSLYRLALRITRHREDAEDVVQDAILKAHANLSRFQGRARFSTWITRITINEALMKLRRNKHRKQVPLEVPVRAEEFDVRYRELEASRENPEAVYVRMEMRNKLLQAARSLSPVDQAVLFQTRVRGCTNQETADALGVALTTVKARLRRACKQLRERLNPISETLPC
jgi:RNA polymerase sigma-70 factor (ECF subfamily)